MDVIEALQARHQAILTICEEKGWDPGSLTFEQVLEIRKDERWKNPLNPNTN